mmetsp:Transcript_18587/g.58473  ORF Transcript_18587/g.58473 Transcript_18587/m.58473 type:complete len:204 (+) Transcript_18587:46-657(+)
MKGLAVVLLGVVVDGFAPAPKAAGTTALSAMSKSIPFIAAPKNLDGMVGNADFDPLGFAEIFDIKYMREAELKHGRVAMMAIIGYIAPEFGVIGPFAPKETFGHANPLVAAVSVPPAAWAGLIISAGFVEIVTNKGKLTYMDMFEDGREPGDFGADYAKLLTPANTEDYKLKEITHCRLAMIAFGGMLHHTFVTGTGVFGSTS